MTEPIIADFASCLWTEKARRWHAHYDADRLRVHGQACEWADFFRDDLEAVRAHLTDAADIAGIPARVFRFDGVTHFNDPTQGTGIMVLLVVEGPTSCDSTCRHQDFANEVCGPIDDPHFKETTER